MLVSGCEEKGQRVSWGQGLGRTELIGVSVSDRPHKEVPIAKVSQICNEPAWWKWEEPEWGRGREAGP